MKAQERTYLKAALVEIENLAAPRHIDRVSAILGIDMVRFAKLGADGMSAVISKALQLDTIPTTNTKVRSIRRQRKVSKIEPMSTPRTYN
ncbi:hypothetical protein PYR71_28775 [Rhizobium sp. MC63]|uniref:Uncharacterized protein n=1 Tax=Rhizobium mulingense TaxID=3031128 RepID=A0ACC6N7V1_9HYPH|nr:MULTISPECIES: hypothetical protein [unclassified Rhizobium]MDF0700399.1 hypothetical protein [Rhizobium sp. MC63]MEA3521116.1 hypothetical protein [Rhizobium sp. MJ31]